MDRLGFWIYNKQTEGIFNHSVHYVVSKTFMYLSKNQ